MVVILEVDNQYCGFGLQWGKRIKGIYAGYVALHFVSSTLPEFLDEWQRVDSEAEGGETHA